MASMNEAINPYNYFKVGFSVNEANVQTFREHYRRLANVEVFHEDNMNEEALLNAAQQLGIQTGSEIYQNILRDCVRYEDIEQALLCVDMQVQGPVQPLSTISPTPPLAAAPEGRLSSSTDNSPPVELTMVESILFLKRSNNVVKQFVEEFFLQKVKKDRINGFRQAPNYEQTFLLDPETFLALFIQERVRALSPVRRRQSKRLHLVEQLTVTDEFGTWSYDHFRGLFDLELRPCSNEPFPDAWTLADNASLRCRIISSRTCSADEKMSTAISDRPRTDSLDQFVHDVCAKEDNQLAQKWVDCLGRNDIFTFSHLLNLKQTEWDHIKILSINAKKILKAAVDRERESAAEDRRRIFEQNTPDPSSPNVTNHSDRESLSQLLADLHLVKLFIYYTLRYDRALQGHSALPKIEATCIDISFDEMRREGFADDGLFPKMGEFFLPLTISEEELAMSRSNLNVEVRRGQLNQIKQDIVRKQILLDEATAHRLSNEERITDIEQTKEQVYLAYVNDRTEVATATEPRQQADRLRRLEQQFENDNKSMDAQLLSYATALQEATKQVEQYEREIDALNEQRINLEAELNQPQRPVDEGLVKPARGFIMFGPPGTGKSEIMSKLSMKLGIVNVGPPLAAGELNRPLVGESERVIIALASRCHRVPYAMCCLSIDEIDSLAPKRDEDSSEGKVDKISVLLSLIDGIKDVPNLMIFCATNRLHMMDEAFLRRMSGKFFVGRPSSDARIKILSQIPDWALVSNLIDSLAIATTNFSGAACKAFTRAVTVRCMAAQRKTPQFQVDHLEALKIADRTAEQYQIFLGSETLPRLLLRNLMKKSNIRIEHLSRHIFTGRIIVDLSGVSARIETVRDDGQTSVVEHKLDRTESNLQSLLKRLTEYGKHRNVQLLQLVDLNLLASQGAYDEKKVFETLKERYDECVAYSRSMIIYDLDALVGVNKSESDSSMGKSFSSTIVNQNVYTYVRARFREAVVEQVEKESRDQQQTVEKWAVAVIREPFLFRQFVADVRFARTKQEEKEAELERRRAEELVKCVKCKDLYIENENKMGSCIHHDGFIYDNMAPDLTVYSYSQAVFQLNRLEREVRTDQRAQEALEKQKTKFKWICCDATVVAGGGGGCKKGKHGFDQPNRDGQRRNPSELNRDMIKQWEETCQRNPEYAEKRLFLLEHGH